MPKRKRNSGGGRSRAASGNGEAVVETPQPNGEAERDVRQPRAIVGIGASAGGLEAFVGLLSHVATNTDIAYVLVQHLDPAHQSMLPEILDRAGNVPVIVATNGLRLEPDRAYVIPPGSSMTVIDGALHVVTTERARGAQTVIDDFFDSLAAVHGTDAIAVVLSGSGSDGAAGIEAIKEHGGITIAQDPRSAQFVSMPQSAIATGCVDFVLTPERIGEELTLIGRHLQRYQRSPSQVSADDAAVQKILLMLRSRTGTDFRAYRRPTVNRRILRRMLAHHSTTHTEYLEHLRNNPEELDALFADLLIGVTHFFRDPEMFTALQQSAFPELMVGRPADSPIRVWVAGCSSGEEAYSFAIALLEFCEEMNAPDIGIQVFATDLSEAAIIRARKAFYPATIEADVSSDRLARFFSREDGGYRVNRRVRDLCIFATQNLTRDPPFSQLDVISCRNVLIYFEPALQQKLIPLFNYALKPNGLLVLGAAESVGQARDYFVPLDKRRRIFRPQAVPRLRVDAARIDEIFPLSPERPLGEPHMQRPTLDDISQSADRAVLDRLGLPGVVINDRLEVTQFRGDTTGLLQHASGTASFHVFKLLRPELLTVLRSAIETARASHDVVRERQIALHDESHVRYVDVEIIPFRSGQARDQYFVILFKSEDTAAQSTAERKLARHTRSRAALPSKEKTAPRHEITIVRDELAETKRYLREVIEQYEGANEELRAANEELQSSLEELQSRGEELETTKEEVQSTNEELTTVNEELRHRNRELAAASADLANIFAGTKIPILIVDSDLLVRRFTPVSDQVLKIIPTDVGRPITDLRLRVRIPDLEKRITTTLSTLVAGQWDVEDDLGRWWSLTIRPYLTNDRKVDGAVLVFLDIDTMKRHSQATEATSEQRRLDLEHTEAAREAAHNANVAKTSFLTHLSHDLRTPLTAISGYADLLDLLVHGPLTSGQQEDVARIKRSSSYLLSLINDILNFAKFDAGSSPLHIGRVSVEDALDSLEMLLDPQLQAKGLSFEHTDCAAYVTADPERLQEILQNIGGNAIKFTSSGGIRIRCRATQNSVVIEVHDTGVGIPPDHLDRIFEPFVQVNRSLTNTPNGGVGLGLAISRTLARAMGGDITAHSVLGEGSTFELTLPRAAD